MIRYSDIPEWAEARRRLEELERRVAEAVERGDVNEARRLLSLPPLPKPEAK